MVVCIDIIDKLLKVKSSWTGWQTELHTITDYSEFGMEIFGWALEDSDNIVVASKIDEAVRAIMVGPLTLEKVRASQDKAVQVVSEMAGTTYTEHTAGLMSHGTEGAEWD